MEILLREDIIDVIWGSAFYSGGGGGSIQNAMMLLDSLPQNETKMILCRLDDMPSSPDYLGCMVAALGSPQATENETFADEAVAAVQASALDASLQGKKLKYLYSGEQGGANTMLAIYAAIKLGMPLIDVDGNGRAVPALTTTLAHIAGLPTSPITLESCQGDTVIVRSSAKDDAALCEQVARELCGVAAPGLGLTAWAVDLQTMQRHFVAGQISKARRIGHVIRNATPGNAMQAIFGCFDRFDLYEYGEGQITSIEAHTGQGFDYGVTTVENGGGTTVKVKFQNENLLVEDQWGNTILTVPDIIILVDRETGRPLSNTETRNGQRVSVLGLKADPKWDTDRGFACWEDCLCTADYRGPRHPVQII